MLDASAVLRSRLRFLYHFRKVVPGEGGGDQVKCSGERSTMLESLMFMLGPRRPSTMLKNARHVFTFMFSMMLYVELKFASKRTLRQHTGAKSRHAIFDGQLTQHAAQMLPKPTRNLYMPMNTYAYIMILD